MNPLTILIVIVVLVLIVMLIRYLIVDPYTLQNIQSGKDASTISASSLAKNGEAEASNFAYSVWFYVNDWNYRYGEPKIILGRMGALSAEGSGSLPGVSGVNPCPAIVLGAVENNVAVSLACYPGAEQTTTTTTTSTANKSIIHTCMVANIPIQKWVNLVVSVYGRSMDLYIDGKLVRTCLLPGIAQINSNADLHVTPKGGFDGWTSKIQYYPNALNPQEVWNIYAAGYTNGLSMFGTYQVQVAIMENGNEKSSITF
jgi:hypothetical protein